MLDFESMYKGLLGGVFKPEGPPDDPQLRDKYERMRVFQEQAAKEREKKRRRADASKRKESTRKRPRPERVVQEDIRTIAQKHGWLVYHPSGLKTGDKGFPDLVLANGRQGRVMFVEVKTDIGKVSKAQKRWRRHLKAAGMEVYLWRDKDVQSGKVKRRLKNPKQRAIALIHYKETTP